MLGGRGGGGDSRGGGAGMTRTPSGGRSGRQWTRESTWVVATEFEWHWISGLVLSQELEVHHTPLKRFFLTSHS